MNFVGISGNICSEVEAFTTQSGISRSTFRVAVQRKFKNANGERDADFLTVVAWKQNADFCNKYLSKGSKVLVEGSIQSRSYDAKDGSKRYVTEIIADHVESLTRAENGAQGGNSGRGVPQGGGSMQNEGFVEVEDDSELPF